MITSIIDRYWRMYHDTVPGWKPRHRGRPALIAPTDHTGATADWSPTAEILAVEVVEPEETTHEAAEREAEELAHHWADLEKAAADETTADLDALAPVLNPLFAAVEEACHQALAALGITEADVDEYAASVTASHDLTELRRLIGATR